MKKDFWLERWERAEIGFHQGEINPYLQRYWPQLQLANGSTVFVPLCGKSSDMVWLRKQGHAVLGVELSDLAARAFFEENGCATQAARQGKFASREADGIHILCGDFFDLEPADLAGVSAVYDRASLVALPPGMRKQYADHLIQILPPETQMLLVTFDYAQAEMPGPPFAVSAEEVADLFGRHAQIQLLETVDALAHNPRFVERGLNRLQENVWLLTLEAQT
jgi:thiopurine S-methyltransferase